MSDNSTNSTVSSSSWTVLTPEETAVETVGPTDSGNAVLEGTAGLPGDVTGSVAEPGEIGVKAPTEGVRSEEGLQVCQETVPVASQVSTPPSPTLLSPSPSSHIPLSANPEAYTSFRPEPDTYPPPSFDAGSHTPPSPSLETYSDTYTHISTPESHINIGPYQESSISLPAPTLGEAGSEPEEEVSQLTKKVTEFGKQADSAPDSELGEGRAVEGDSLRKRKVFPIGPLDRAERQRGEEEEEEEEFRPIEREQDGGGFSLNKCILGALILLGLGTILFSGFTVDPEDEEDVEVRELRDADIQGYQQEMKNPDADPLRVQEMAELLDKLAKENQQITLLQTQLQAQKEELNLALQRLEGNGNEVVGKVELEKENERMRMELSSLPGLQRELETLKLRVAELAHITANEGPSPSVSVLPSTGQTESGNQSAALEQEAGEETDEQGRLAEKLERQKVLLEESRRRLEGMKGEGGGKTGVRDGLAEMGKRLTEEVEKLGRRDEERRKEGRKRRRQWESEGETGNGGGRSHGGREWKGEKDQKRGRDFSPDNGKEWKERGEGREWRAEKDWKQGRDGEKVKEGDYKREWQGEKYGRHGKDGEKVKEGDYKREWQGEKYGRHGKDGEKVKEGDYKREWQGEKYGRHGRDGEKDKGKDWKEREKSREWPRDGQGEELKNGEWKKLKEDSHKDEWRTERDERHPKGRDESRAEGNEKARKERHWQGTADKTPPKNSHRHHDHNDYWKRKREKLQNYYRPLVDCTGIADCAKVEGLVPVRLVDFEDLLGSYLSKLGESEVSSQDKINALVKEFFVDGVFSHDKMSFKDFVEDVADILEDMAEGEENDSMEDEMEEFEKEALRKFRLSGGERKENDRVSG